MLTELCCCTIIIIIVVVIWLRLFGRAIIVRSRPEPPPYTYASSTSFPPVPPGQEVNMIKCSHCGRMYDESLPGCPGCGGF